MRHHVFLFLLAFLSLGMTPQEAEDLKKELGLKNPVISVRVVARPRQDGSWTTMHVAITNKSNVHLGAVWIRTTLYGAKGELLATNSIGNVDNLKPGATKEADILFRDTVAAESRTWKFTLDKANLVTHDGEEIFTDDAVFELETPKS